MRVSDGINHLLLAFDTELVMRSKREGAISTIFLFLWASCIFLNSKAALMFLSKKSESTVLII